MGRNLSNQSSLWRLYAKGVHIKCYFIKPWNHCVWRKKIVSSSWRIVWISRPSILQSTYASPQIWLNCMVPIISLKSPGWAKKRCFAINLAMPALCQGSFCTAKHIGQNCWNCSISPQIRKYLKPNVKSEAVWTFKDVDLNCDKVKDSTQSNTNL